MYFGLCAASLAWVGLPRGVCLSASGVCYVPSGVCYPSVESPIAHLTSTIFYLMSNISPLDVLHLHLLQELLLEKIFNPFNKRTPHLELNRQPGVLVGLVDAGAHHKGYLVAVED